MADEFKREVAIIKGFSIERYENTENFMINATFAYSGGSFQGLGYVFTKNSLGGFIDGIMNALGVSRLDDIKGRYCFVTHNDIKITKIEHIFDTDTEFDIAEFWKGYNE